jgi:hypothetical protein
VTITVFSHGLKNGKSKKWGNAARIYNKYNQAYESIITASKWEHFLGSTCKHTLEKLQENAEQNEKFGPSKMLNVLYAYKCDIKGKSRKNMQN